ncbi:MAG: TRAP transporter substrate-binding protein [Clostridiales Family XIII bacterium]|nr:TRAP transporter substrate-binding protein [Clostridiales Family XIII bacterium]
MSLKKSICILLVLSLIFLFGGCAQKDVAPGADGGTADAARTFVMKIGTTVTDDSPGGLILSNYFKPEIEKLSGGRVTVEIYNNSVLGGDRQLVESLQLGTLESCWSPLSVLSNFDAKFGASDLPFVYKNPETAYAALDGDWGALLAKDLPNQGIRLLAYGENSFRNLSNNVRPIEKLEDMKGIKFRVMESPIYIATFTALGANPTPIPFAELYTALQNGTVDGQDNGTVLTYTNKLYEVQKYYTISGQQYSASPILVSENWWGGVPEDLQKIIADAALEACRRNREDNKKAETEYIKLIEASGTKVNVLSDAEKERFREACLPVWDNFVGEFGEDVIAAAHEINDKYGS